MAVVWKMNTERDTRLADIGDRGREGGGGVGLSVSNNVYPRPAG